MFKNKSVSNVEKAKIQIEKDTLKKLLIIFQNIRIINNREFGKQNV